MRLRKCETAEIVTRFGFCEDFVELLRLIPRPRDMGAFIAMIREKRQRKGIIFMTGLTEEDVSCLLNPVKEGAGERNDNLTALCKLIASKLDTPKIKITIMDNRLLLS